jgi:hypothetical protein
MEPSLTREAKEKTVVKAKDRGDVERCGRYILSCGGGLKKGVFNEGNSTRGNFKCQLEPEAAAVTRRRGIT